MNKIKVNAMLLIAITFFISSILPKFCFATDDEGDYIHYRLGVKYKDEKRYDDAIEEFRKVLAEYPDNYNAYMHMAEIRQIQGQTNLVVFNLKKALKYNPGWNKVHKMLADAYEKDGQYQDAIGELQTYMQSCDPAERDNLQKTINQMMSRKTSLTSDSLNKSGKKVTSIKNNKSSSITGSKNVVTLDKNPVANTLFNDAIQLYGQQKYDQALDKLKQVRNLQPDFTGVYYYGGLIRDKTGQSKMAKTNFLKAVDYPDKGYNAHLYLGKIYAQENNFDEAIRQLSMYLKRAMTEDEKKNARELIESYKKSGGKVPADLVLNDTSKVDTSLDISGNKLIPQEKYSTPIEIQIDTILSMMTVDTLTDAGQKLLSGIHEFTQGNYEQSIREFKRTLASNPTGMVALNCLYNTGICYYKMHLFKEAENQFQQVIEKFSQNPIAAQSLFLKGCTYLERDESSTAAQILCNFLQSNKSHKWTGIAFEKLGDAYTDMNQDKKAIDAYTQATLKDQNPVNQVEAFFKLGSAYSKIGSSSHAIDAFKSAIATGEGKSIYVRVPDSYYRIADEKYKEKDLTSAMDYYTRVTRKYPAYQETPWGLFQIGTIYKAQKKLQESVAIFKELIHKYPDDYWAKQAKWKMDDAIWENEYKAVLN